MDKTRVAIVRGSSRPGYQELSTNVRKAIDLAGGLSQIIKPGNLVIIKPNVVAPMTPESGVTTDPRICKAIADIVTSLGARPIIAESSQVGTETEKSFEAAGYDKLREEGYKVIDLKNKGLEFVKVPVPQGKSLKEVVLPKIVLDANIIISVPKMKTHDGAKVTLALKNMKGIMPDKWKRSLHHKYGVPQGVADLCTVVKPSFAVVDGLIGMEGLGPADGTRVELGLIIAGADPVAVDTITALVMGFEPETEGCIAAAAEAGIGIHKLKRIEVKGEPVKKVAHRFQRVEEAFAAMDLPKDFSLVMDEKACSGCRNILTEVLTAVRDARQLDRLSGWTVLTGKTEKLPDINPAKVIMIGQCLAKFKDGRSFVEGCPPHCMDVVKGLRPTGISVVCGLNIDAIDSLPD